MKPRLDQLDLSFETDPADFKRRMDAMEQELGDLQRQARARGIPVAIVLEGWDAAGKGACINRLSLAFDARGVSVHSMDHVFPETDFRPWMWRYWCEAPSRGRITIYDRGWFGRAAARRGHRDWARDELDTAILDINRFERMLIDDGTLLLKFFFHLSRREQKRRLRKLDDHPDTEWRVTKSDWKEHEKYDRYLELYQSMIDRTNRQDAAWTLVPCDDRRTAELLVFRAIATALERRLKKKDARRPGAAPAKGAGAKPARAPSILGGVDLSARLDRDVYGKELKKSQKRLYELEHRIYRERIPVVVAYEGWDAAGKGGNIRRLLQGLDPRGYRVIPIAAPTPQEKARHYLRRFWIHVPKAGHLAVFDRTWYGRVLVERVEGFCTPPEWNRAYDEINDMERQWTDFGVVLVKFWMQIDPDTQLRRFKEREGSPHKRWKITDEDWRNREKWPAYEAAVNDMLARTDTDCAPWTIIESNDKLHARIKALHTVIEAIEKRL